MEGWRDVWGCGERSGHRCSVGSPNPISVNRIRASAVTPLDSFGGFGKYILVNWGGGSEAVLAKGDG